MTFRKYSRHTCAGNVVYTLKWQKIIYKIKLNNKIIDVHVMSFRQKDEAREKKNMTYIYIYI